MYPMNSATLIWSYKAQWAWEIDVIAKAAVEAVQNPGTSTKSTLESVLENSSSVLDALETVGVAATVTAVTAAADEMLQGDQEDAGSSSEVPSAPVAHEDISVAGASGSALPELFARLLPAAAQTVFDPKADVPEGARGKDRVDDQEAAAAPSGRWVSKGYRTLYAHTFSVDLLREAVVDAQHEVRESDGIDKINARKPTRVDRPLDDLSP
jgi:hypothetical protein